MADTKNQAEGQSRSKDAEPTQVAPPPVAPAPAAPPATIAGATAPRPTGIAPAPAGGVKIGSEPNPLSKGQRKHLRRQKEAGQIKVTSRRSQVSR